MSCNLMVVFSKILFVLLCSTVVINDSIGQSNYCIGDILTIESEVLDESRTLNIYLPSNYHSDTSYQVLYVLDGSYNEDFLHIVGLVQFYELQAQLPPTIVVGIGNVDRKRDFTFYPKDTTLFKNFPSSGYSQNFISFIRNEVQPTIESNYPTNGRKILIGQSLGGLLASEILLTASGMFTDYLIVSPSMWWDNEALLKQSKALFKKQKNKPNLVYIAVGKEGRIMKRGAKGLYRSIQASKPNSSKLQYNYMKSENHATILHNSIYEAFDWMFGMAYK